MASPTVVDTPQAPSKNQIPCHMLRKPRKSRTKTGCLSCRLRRKKCDETKPVCTGCSRNDLICTWPQAVGDTSKTTGDLGWRAKLAAGDFTAGQLIGEAPDAAQSSSQALQLVRKQSQEVSAVQPVTRALHRLSPQISTWRFNSDASDSYAFLQQFSEKTAPQIVATLPQDNALLRFVLPWAATDDMIMDAMLAMGGAHLSYVKDDSRLRRLTLGHYLSTMTKLKHALTHWKPGSESTLRLLTVSIMLCEYEALAGSPESTANHHLRACREFTMALLNSRMMPQELELYGFLLESYSYMTIVSTATQTFDQRRTRALSDWFVQSLQHLHGLPTFGNMFGCAAELFEMIPQLYELHDSPEGLDLETCEMFEQRVLDWKPLDDLPPSTSRVPGSLQAGLIFQLSMLAFIQAHIHRLKGLKKHDFEQKMIPLIDQYFELVHLMFTSPLATTMLWPILVMSSCMSLEEHKQMTRMGFKQSGFQMAIVGKACLVLEQIWVMSDEDVFGPMALDRVAGQFDFDLT